MRRPTTVAVSLLLLALVAAAHELVPAPEDVTAPIAHAGEAGEVVDARGFTIEVGEVRIARTVVEEDLFGEGSRETANGVWVVVPAVLTSTSTSSRVASPVLLETGGGYTHSAVTRLSSTLNSQSPQLDPGIAVRGAFVFELPPERLTRAVLRVTVSEGLDTRLAAEAVVDLGLSPAELRRLTADAAETTVPPVEYGHPDPR
ncbi:hypothetical protein ACQEU5_09080 [Marinactinospora thermotolerans]|uniref:DUF4352 domain-containing protein n=1 Tax=Marinactinospora thermotolerans DSM 45154 TaxID=1122192 RepID=A0A1T4T369_9ACTN|nr:DUF4352 domain-containing protein [Marinactinospora thermotolerans]SKA34711.1 hypothetical protein SAMN02745673_04358 [Marinactinospora thermotolerans DSM 45154]